MRSYQPTDKGHRGQIKRAVQTLLDAKRPVLYTGGGVVIDNASEHLIALAERAQLSGDEYFDGAGSLSWH